jgi:predicted Fe-Mo cluster-binding NifX family protein
MRGLIIGFVGVLCTYLGLASAALAQKGVGDLSGVASQPVQPEVVSFSGKIVEIKTDPCESTTGRSPVGTHIILEIAPKEQFNIHLGPAAAVADTVAKLAVGQPLAVRAFRTEKMKENHYVAQTLTFGKTTVELRDAGLRPVWAASSGGPRGPAAGQTGPGRGRGPGWGRGAGLGLGTGGGRNGRWWAAPPQDEPAAPKQSAGKIAVTAAEPSLDAAVDPQFGRCPYFLLIDAEKGTFEAVKNTSTSGGNAGVQAAQMIAAKGARILFTGKCGPKALESLAAAGIQVVPDCSGTVRAVVEQFQAGQLRPASKKEATSEAVRAGQPSTQKQGGNQ